MPKRSYPFEETFSSQYKIHVGQKEMNHHGVFGSKYRQEIYEKTKNLLFNGAKAVIGTIWKLDGEGNQSCIETAGPSVITENRTLLRGQTMIGLDGKLRRTGPDADTPRTSAACCVCLKGTGKKACSQCDRSVCPSCIRQCSDCSGLCCSVCTIVDYSDRYDRVLCCDCSA
ncbi:apoptosis regulatory protein Siva [Conger conger]|uniref:apoptosis regulatory protein Siva n=1 Tax=Conger conger TaxID=82655 RepID=UPI002A59BBCC|nr:apoptosis regulatory protein Siva [Conger conger]